MTKWNSPNDKPSDAENYQVLCRVLPDEIAHPMRSLHVGVSSGDHGEGDLFVSIGWPDENNDAESGWFVAGWDMSQDCWSDARRYQVLGWLPMADAVLNLPLGDCKQSPAGRSSQGDNRT